jgi:hypothetical protein
LSGKTRQHNNKKQDNTTQHSTFSMNFAEILNGILAGKVGRKEEEDNTRTRQG